MKRPIFAVAALMVSLPLVAGPSRAAGPDCHPITVPARSAIPAGTTTCGGVRPGAIVQSTLGLCTQNFIFRGSDGYRYVGTAGHCILDGGAPVNLGDSQQPGETVWALGRGPIATDAAGNRIGRFAYAIFKDPKDFALIRIDKSVPVSATMCYFGGPVGINISHTGISNVHYYGNAAGIGTVVPARTAVATLIDNADHIYAWGLVVPGDSGGPLIDDNGRALGVIVTTGVHEGDNIMSSGTIGATRLAPQLARAAYRLRIKLTMVNGAFTSDTTIP